MKMPNQIFNAEEEKIQLLEAFKIENKVLLRNFDRLNEVIEDLNASESIGSPLGLNTTPEVNNKNQLILKGLFVKIKKKDLLNTLLFGFRNIKDREKEFKRKYLRLPSKFIKGGKSVVEGMLHSP